MAVVTAARRCTPEDLLAIQDGSRYELVDGELVERGMGTEAAWIASELGALLSMFVRERHLGWVLAAEASYQCFPWDSGRVRRPDVSFIAAGRLPGNRLPRGHASIAPDLAVEVVSPNDGYSEVRGKVREYLRAGVRLVWVIDPDSRCVEVSGEGRFAVLDEAAELGGEEVLPGFCCRVADFLPPEPEAVASPQPLDSPA
jgi:Uma2 family endonuclease